LPVCALITGAALSSLPGNKVLGTPCRFASRFPLDIAVARLAGACLPEKANTLTSSWLIGKVDQRSVHLCYHAYGLHPRARPFFAGSFVADDNAQVHLHGQFRQPGGFGQFVFFFLLIYAFAIATFIWVTESNQAALSGMVASGCMLAVLTFLSMASGRQSAEDIAWMTSTIKSIL
jgi:hypothetical protein